MRATGKLADPTDLPFDEDHLDDPDKLAAAQSTTYWHGSRTWRRGDQAVTSGRAQRLQVARWISPRSCGNEPIEGTQRVVQLHFNGSVFDLDEDQSVADVFNFLNNYTKTQDGQVWLKLADGGTVHIQVDGQPTWRWWRRGL